VGKKSASYKMLSKVGRKSKEKSEKLNIFYASAWVETGNSLSL
jgi:hypothetical protein